MHAAQLSPFHSVPPSPTSGSLCPSLSVAPYLVSVLSAPCFSGSLGTSLNADQSVLFVSPEPSWTVTSLPSSSGDTLLPNSSYVQASSSLHG